MKELIIIKKQQLFLPYLTPILSGNRKNNILSMKKHELKQDLAYLKQLEAKNTLLKMENSFLKSTMT